MGARPHRGPSTQGSTSPYEHRDFSLPSTWVPTNIPPAVTALVEFDELELVKATPKAPVQRNLPRAECQASKELKCRHNIIIKPADKGSAVVIMNVKDYLNEGNRQLADRNFYRPIDVDLTEDHTNIVFNTVEKLLDKGEISSKMFEYLTHTKPRAFGPELFRMARLPKENLIFC